jgi:hypothetical protein
MKNAQKNQSEVIIEESFEGNWVPDKLVFTEKNKKRGSIKP